MASTGHYVAIIKTGDAWELHDDDKISNIHPYSVFSQHSFENVFLLTYKRQLFDISGYQAAKMNVPSMMRKVYAPEGISKMYLSNTRVVGLKNVGNFCYINALFRLLSISLLPYLFKESSMKESLTSFITPMPLTRIFYEEWRLDLAPRVAPLLLNKLVNHVQCKMDLGVGQHDLSELFNLILPTMFKECESLCDTDIMSFTRRTKINCCSNNHPDYVVLGAHETYLPVAIPLSGKVKLEDLIKREESMELNPSHICTVCSHIGTRSILEFQSTCKFLSVLVKRIEYKSNNQARKLKTQVEFTKSLNITVNSIGNEEEKVGRAIKFDLVGFAKHIGSLATRGHYVAITKNGDLWELHDDDKISTIHQNAVFSEHSFQNVYLLTYRRVDQRN